jgi:hypothetical protein
LSLAAAAEEILQTDLLVEVEPVASSTPPQQRSLLRPTRSQLEMVVVPLQMEKTLRP